MSRNYFPVILYFDNNSVQVGIAGEARPLTLSASDREWAGEWETDKFASLAKVVKYLVTQRLLLTPSRTKLFVIDSGMPVSWKLWLCDKMLSYCTTSITFLPHSVCCAVSANCEDAIVVNSHPQWFSFAAVGLLIPMAMDLRDPGEDLGQVADALADFIKALPIDTRRRFSKHIIYVGNHVPFDPLQVQRLVSWDIGEAYSLGAWAGASILCSTTLPTSGVWKTKEVTRDKILARWLEIQTLNV